VIENIKKLCELLDDFAEVQKEKGEQIPVLQSVTTKLAFRIRINLEASIPTIEKLDEDNNQFLPLAIIFRSIISDILTFCYLIRFFNVDTDKNDQPSLMNELNILDKDFISSFLQAVQKEQTIPQYIPEIQFSKTQEQLQKDLESFKQRFAHILIDGKVKSNKALRYTTLNKFFKTIKDRENPNGMLSESYKYDRILEEDFFKNFAPINTVFKYLSQYQHFSRFSEIIWADAKRNKYYLYLSVDLTYMTFIVFFQLIEQDDNEWLEKLKTLKEEFSEIVEQADI
jgi:hypothetical protein